MAHHSALAAWQRRLIIGPHPPSLHNQRVHQHRQGQTGAAVSLLSVLLCLSGHPPGLQVHTETSKQASTGPREEAGAESPRLWLPMRRSLVLEENMGPTFCCQLMMTGVALEFCCKAGQKKRWMDGIAASSHHTQHRSERDRRALLLRGLSVGDEADEAGIELSVVMMMMMVMMMVVVVVVVLPMKRDKTQQK